MKDLLLQYTKYNLWANTKLLGFIESAAAKDPAVLDKEIPSSFNTLRKTLYHIYYAENIWYKRLRFIRMGSRLTAGWHPLQGAASGSRASFHASG